MRSSSSWVKFGPICGLCTRSWSYLLMRAAPSSWFVHTWLRNASRDVVLQLYVQTVCIDESWLIVLTGHALFYVCWRFKYRIWLNQTSTPPKIEIIDSHQSPPSGLGNLSPRRVSRLLFSTFEMLIASRPWKQLRYLDRNSLLWPNAAKPMLYLDYLNAISTHNCSKAARRKCYC